MMSRADKYVEGANDNREKSTGRSCYENVTDCGCEPCQPDRETFVYTLVFIVLGVGAVVAGTYLGRETMQAIKDYNFPVTDDAGIKVAMANFLTLRKVAAVYIPKGNMTSYHGSSTQTFFDFETNLASIVDWDNRLCFVHDLNKAELVSFEKVKGALVNGGKIVSVAPTITAGKITATDAPYNQVKRLGRYARNECLEMKKVFTLLPKAPIPGNRINCTVTNLPHYAVTEVAGKASLQITDINAIETSCVTP